MKELSIEEKVKRSIEEKAKAYDEALERARKELQICGSSDCDAARQIFRFFPELKESEDEKIRKWLINEIKINHHNLDEDSVDFVDKAIAWLEKQGEQTSNKVEPRFKNGQWVVWQDKCYTVNYNGCGYELVDQNGLSTSLEYGTINENAHLWDIAKDAKDADVLLKIAAKKFNSVQDVPFEQVPAWSEEDKILLKLSLENLTELKDEK